MKLLTKILVPFSIVPALLTPVCLVGCGNNDKPDPEKTDFIVKQCLMTSPTEAKFQLDWTNGHSLTFGKEWKFITSFSSVKSITSTGGDTRPQIITVVFDNKIVKDITDGTLTFTYNDLTTKQEKVSATIDNICIGKFGKIEWWFSKDGQYTPYFFYTQPLPAQDMTVDQAKEKYWTDIMNNNFIFLEDLLYSLSLSTTGSPYYDSYLSVSLRSLTRDGTNDPVASFEVKYYSKYIITDPGQPSFTIEDNYALLFKNIPLNFYHDMSKQIDWQIHPSVDIDSLLTDDSWVFSFDEEFKYGPLDPVIKNINVNSKTPKADLEEIINAHFDDEDATWTLAWVYSRYFWEIRGPVDPSK